MHAFQNGTTACWAASALRSVSYTAMSAASVYCALTPQAWLVAPFEQIAYAAVWPAQFGCCDVYIAMYPAVPRVASTAVGIRLSSQTYSLACARAAHAAIKIRQHTSTFFMGILF